MAGSFPGRQLCPHVGLCPTVPYGRHPVWQQEVHEHKAPGGDPGGCLHCRLTSCIPESTNQFVQKSGPVDGCGMKKRQVKNANGLRMCFSFGGPFFSVCSLSCGQSLGHLLLHRLKVTKAKQNRPFKIKKAVFVELLGRFELPTSSLPSDPRDFFLTIFRAL